MEFTVELINCAVNGVHCAVMEFTVQLMDFTEVNVVHCAVLRD